ncbi:DsbA family protein [Phreatobacter sp.]|uniref:DsbA family protein n=1 Tax=Phreatobacter sp. TaxID=1966341 RepID=UPI003F711485
MLHRLAKLARTGLIAGALALTAPLAPVLAQGAPAQPTAEERARIEAIVRDYLLRNPEVLQEALVELERRQAQAEERARTEAFQANRDRLYRSPNAVVLGNPQGDVTLVEFFDYNCGFCKRALPETVELLRSDPRIRLVLKDFPVLGPGSVEAAQVAIALKMQLDGPKYFEFHQKLLGGRGQANRARALEAARDVGADMARLERDMASPQVAATLAENARLAELLRINGTPSYVVGDDVVVGAVGLARLRENIVRARATCGRQVGVC